MINLLKISLCLIALTMPTKALAQQSDPNQYILSKGKAGVIEIGQTIDDLYEHFDRSATRLVDLQLEGSFSPAIEVYFDSSNQKKPSFIAEIRWWREVGWAVGRITIKDDTFKTEKGIGIGSTFGEILQFYKVTSVSAGESPYLFAIVRELGMSFQLDITYQDMPSQWRRTKDLNLIPKDSKVRSILVTGHPPQSRSKSR